MTAYQEIIKLLPQLPFEVLKDIERRTGDWMWSGGNEDDPYIQQQLRYAKEICEGVTENDGSCIGINNHQPTNVGAYVLLR